MGIRASVCGVGKRLRESVDGEFFCFERMGMAVQLADGSVTDGESKSVGGYESCSAFERLTM